MLLFVFDSFMTHRKKAPDRLDADNDGGTVRKECGRL